MVFDGPFRRKGDAFTPNITRQNLRTRTLDYQFQCPSGKESEGNPAGTHQTISPCSNRSNMSMIAGVNTGPVFIQSFKLGKFFCSLELASKTFLN